MKSKVVLSVVLVLVIAGVIAGIKVLQIRSLIAAGKTMVMPPEAVSSAVATNERWEHSLNAIGSITAVQGVDVTTEVAGTVREIAFESGASVKEGDLLLRLDASTEEAQLRATMSQVEWARVSAERARVLRADNTVSQSELDQAEASLKQAAANVDAIKAAIEKKTIRAPFAGRLGIRLVNLGEYLDSGNPIVSLQSLSPVHADFSLPQQELSKLAPGMRVRVLTDAYPDKRFEGTLTAINPDVNISTRSVRLQATLENSEHLMRPGMFARIEVLLPGENEVLVIPSTAVLSAPYGDMVYIIEPGTNQTGEAQLIVRQQLVRTGRSRGDFVSVEMGLKPGERVASSGVFKLRNGMHVVENNDLAPKTAETPKPADS